MWRLVAEACGVWRTQNISSVEAAETQQFLVSRGLLVRNPLIKRGINRQRTHCFGVQLVPGLRQNFIHTGLIDKGDESEPSADRWGGALVTESDV